MIPPWWFGVRAVILEIQSAEWPLVHLTVTRVWICTLKLAIVSDRQEGPTSPEVLFGEIGIY